MFNSYYQDELLYLRQLGREYAQAYPETAKLLGDQGTDPDVERLLEGTAFITGRLRQKLDDELPELTHALLETFWPQLLRPIPSMAVVQFEAARAQDKELRAIPAGTALDSVPVDGTRCRFRTAYEAVVAPLRIGAVTLKAHGAAALTIRVALNGGLKAGQLGLDRLRLHCAGAAQIAGGLYACLTRHAQAVTLVAGERRVALPAGSIKEAGFAPGDALMGRPDAAFHGFSLLHEYFAFPGKFLFVDLANLAAGLARIADAGEFAIEIALARTPRDMPAPTEANLLLGCTPVVNEFPHAATPFRIEAERREFRILPGGGLAAHIEICAIDRVTGVVQGSGKPTVYRPLYQQQRRGETAGYLVRRRPALLTEGSDSYLTVSGAVPDETISIETIATNRRLPMALGPGDISHPTDQCPSGVRFRNLAKPSAPVNPPLGTAMEWQLLAHLGLNYRTLASVESLTALLDLYDLRAQVDHQARQSHRRLVESIERIAAAPTTRISDGVPMRGVAIDLTLKDGSFDGEGEMQLFATLLDHVFAGYVGLNSFSQLTVRGAANGDVHERPPRLGARRLV
jgi:type VI secretion system protein ImpG